MTITMPPTTKRPSRPELDFLYTIIEKVGAFRVAFQQPSPRGWSTCDTLAMNTQANLIKEEFQEFMDAKTRVDKLDALCDIAYVLAGGFIACGYRGRELETCDKIVFSPFIRIIPAAVNRLRSASCAGGCLRDVGSALLTTARTGRQLFGAGNFFNAFMAVHDNNMAKLWSAEQFTNAFDKTTMSFMQVPPAPGRLSTSYLVKRKSDGKVIKPSDFVKVNLEPFANAVSHD